MYDRFAITGNDIGLEKKMAETKVEAGEFRCGHNHV
jgi:hypothetical protein